MSWLSQGRINCFGSSPGLSSWGQVQKRLVVFYTVKIRRIIMFGAACCHSALTSEQSERLQLQQKQSLAIILDKKYRIYENTRVLVNLPTLRALRESVCLKLALKSAASPQHSHLFPLNQSRMQTRHQQKYLEYHCKGSRYYHSAVPAMTRSLNQYHSKLAASHKSFFNK